jgi:hypothetical protein
MQETTPPLLAATVTPQITKTRRRRVKLGSQSDDNGVENDKAANQELRAINPVKSMWLLIDRHGHEHDGILVGHSSSDATRY